MLGAALLAGGLVSNATPQSGPLLSATQVGPLLFGRSTVGQLQTWAGKPQHTWRFKGNGRLDANGLFFRGAEAYGYGCKEPVDTHGCRTVFAFKAGRLLGFYTTETRFHTAAGTRVGIGLTRARSLEKHGTWAGFSVQCPAIVLSRTTTEFKADVRQRPAPPRVSDFLVSQFPAAFADGC